MLKSDILNRLHEKQSNLSEEDIEQIFNIFTKNIIGALKLGKSVELRGFGTFGVKHRMPKKARNPGTGDAIYLPERYVPTFKPSKIMRSRVNELTKK